MNKTLHAGYMLDGVKDKLYSLDDGIDWQDVLRFLSEFTIESTNTCEIATSDPLIAVADNIISRGLPTKPSLLIEENFRNKFQHINRNINKKVGYIPYKLIDNTQDEILKRAFLIVDPRLHPRTNHQTDYILVLIHGNNIQVVCTKKDFYMKFFLISVVNFPYSFCSHKGRCNLYCHFPEEKKTFLIELYQM